MKEVTKSIWVLTSPDNEHWDEGYSQVEISRLMEKWNVETISGYPCRDTGFGKETLLTITGQPVMVEGFVDEVEEVFY